MKTSAQQRALDWQINSPREQACSVCGAAGPILAIGDTDVMHTRFAARCEKHFETRPRLRKYYGMVKKVELDPAQLGDLKWFQSNPERTTRLRLTQACENSKAEGIPMLVRKYPSGQCVRIVVMGPLSDNMTDKELSDIHAQLFDRYYHSESDFGEPNGDQSLKTGGAV